MARLITKATNPTVAVPGTPAVIQADANTVASVTITAAASNVGTIYVGDSNIDATSEIGTPIAAGKNAVINPSSIAGELEKINLASIYYDGTNAADAISYSYVEVDE